VWWRSALTLRRVIRLSRQAPRQVSGRWDNFWAGVSATGDGGDVLWDASDSDEAPHYRDLLAAHADLQLPLVDIGCGNGRFTRALALRFPRALGVDISPAAIARAQAETTSVGTRPSQVTFRALDVTHTAAGSLLHGDLGQDANVFVRGLFHILDVPARRQAAASIAEIVGSRGVVLIAETNYRGSRIHYLESLGAGPRAIPAALARIIATGMPAPLAFGAAELADCFPAARWNRAVIDADATITTIPLSTPDAPDELPGFLAVLSPRDAATPPGT